MIFKKLSVPATVDELLVRARSLAGMTLKEVSVFCDFAELPEDQKREKGKVGELLERYLGATAGNQALPDFPQLGIELKTIPVDRDGFPKESTFVCSIPLLKVAEETWETSTVWRKLRCVLWIPIEVHADIPLSKRRVGWPVLWQPNPSQVLILREDWQELVDMIVLGRITEISARQGRFLQVRPKAADTRALTWATDISGTPIQTLPRGFYLRTRFTRDILQDGGQG